MKTNRLLLTILILFSAKDLFSQNPVPLIFKPLRPPMSRLIYLEKMGLIGVGNANEIQFWDVKSKAYYGVITVIAPELTQYSIGQVEYIESKNKIAVVLNSYTYERDSTNISSYLSLYDPITLLRDSGNLFIKGGLTQLLRYKYGANAMPLKFIDEANLSDYYYDSASRRLLTIDYNGNVHAYKDRHLTKVIHTGVQASSCLLPAKNFSTIFVSDYYSKELREIDLSTGEKLFSVGMQGIPNNHLGLPASSMYQWISVAAMPEEKAICLLDSINRIRLVNIETSTVQTFRSDQYNNQTLTSLIPHWSDSSLYAIGENNDGFHTQTSFYTNLKTGTTHHFSGGVFAYISSASSTGKDAKCRVLFSGIKEVEIDLATLSEKTIRQTGMNPNERISQTGSWEKGYYHIVEGSQNGLVLRVYKKDSATTSLYYTTSLQIGNRYLFPYGIFAREKGFYKLDDDRKKFEFYDQTGVVTHTVPTSLNQYGQYYGWDVSFSTDGDYFLLKEQLNYGKPIDTFRLRVFSAVDFNVLADLRTSEVTDLNTYARKTAVFANNGFYFVNAVKKNGKTTNSLVHYALNNGKAEKKYELPLCIDDGCDPNFTIRNIAPNLNGKVLMWFGFVPADFRAKREAYQFVRFTDCTTGKRFGGVNLPHTPQIEKALPFPGYVGLQYPDHIDFLSMAADATQPFLSVVPFINDQTYDLSLIHSTFDDVSQQRYYYERTNTDQCVSFRLGRQSFPRRIFDVSYNRPDIVISKVPGYDTATKQLFSAAVARRMERVKNRMENFKPEAIPVLNLEKTNYEENGDFSIKVKASSPAGIEKFYITINGNRVDKNVVTGMYKGYDGFYYHFREQLTNGENAIELIAVDRSGMESLPLRLSQRHNRPADKPNLFLLVASVGEYSKDLTALPYAVKDGRDVATLISGLRSDTMFKSVTVDSLFDSNVDQQAITKWIKEKKNLSPADYVIVFYSGHGFLDKNLDLRLATSSTTLAVSDVNSINYENIISEMDLLPARQKLFLIDACHSGDFDKNSALVKTNGNPISGEKGLIGESIVSKDNSFEMMQNLFSFSEPGRGTVVLSAAGGAQPAFEAAKYQNGYFTYALKEAIGKGFASDDPLNRLWLHQLVRYVAERVTVMSEGRQQPNLRISNSDLNWRLR